MTVGADGLRTMPDGSPFTLKIDIGAEKMRFKDMLLGAARVMGLKRLIVPVPVLSPGLSSYWLKLMTPVPFPIAGALVQGLKSETTIQNDNARIYFPRIHPLSYEESFRRALDEIEKNQVISRWCDSTANKTCDIEGLDRLESAVYREKISADFGALPADSVFSVVESIGGDNGWFTYHWLWRLRGFIDILFAGPGLSRGRRDPDRLRIGDGLDFWKVVDIKPGKRLLLYAQMKVPGEAWLEFDVQPDQLVQTAHFLPRGILGRLYWYLVLPLHHFVFNNLARTVVSSSTKSG